MRRFHRRFALPALAAALAVTAAGCDANEPGEGDEPESITRVEVTFTGPGGTPLRTIATVTGTTITYTPVTLAANTAYTGTVAFFNGTEDVTPEIRAEGTAHALFYTPAGLNLTISRTDRDANGVPLGLAFTAQTGAAGTGTVRVELVHYDDQPKTDALPGATLERDFIGTFPVTVQ